MNSATDNNESQGKSNIASKIGLVLGPVLSILIFCILIFLYFLDHLSCAVHSLRPGIQFLVFLLLCVFEFRFTVRNEAGVTSFVHTSPERVPSSILLRLLGHEWTLVSVSCPWLAHLSSVCRLITH